MNANYVKWMSPSQIPHINWTPKTGYLSRYALNVPCDIGDRLGTCDIYVTGENGSEDGSVIDVRLPYKHQDDAPGPFDFQLTETPAKGKGTAVPQGLFLPVDLRGLVKLMVVSDDSSLDADGIELSDFDALFPDVAPAAEEK